MFGDKSCFNVNHFGSLFPRIKNVIEESFLFQATNVLFGKHIFCIHFKTKQNHFKKLYKRVFSSSHLKIVMTFIAYKNRLGDFCYCYYPKKWVFRVQSRPLFFAYGRINLFTKQKLDNYQGDFSEYHLYCQFTNYTCKKME